MYKGSKRAKRGSHDGDGVVVEDCRYVFRRKLVRSIADEQTCLADGAVANNDAPVEGIVSTQDTHIQAKEVEKRNA